MDNKKSMKKTLITQWFQKQFTLKARFRGCYLITQEILQNIKEQIRNIEIGTANIFLKHSSAGLALNQNADSTVRKDMEKIFNRLVPEGNNLYDHDSEGAEDMPAHAKSVLSGHSLTIPITRGNLNLGTWQGIWLLEFRNAVHHREVVVTIHGGVAQ